jgi:hypothetical protein
MSGIRKATIEDIHHMSRLWAALVMEENPEAKPDRRAWENMQKRLFALRNYYAYVAENGNGVVGFNNGLVLTDMETGERYVEGGNFYVLPEHRMGFAGRMLHRNSFQVAKSVGAKFLRRHVSTKNQRMVDRMMKSRKHVVKEYIVDEMIGGV